MRRKSSLVIGLLVIAVLIGLTGLPMAQAQESIIPAPTGPYQIGTVTHHWVDESREETFTPEEGDQLEVVVQFWYPADVRAGENMADYISSPEIVMPVLDSMLSDGGMFITITSEGFVGAQSHTVANAPLADSEDTYPILLFSPGWGGTPQMYTAQLEELASQGYIVAGINHPYISAVTFLQDGRTANVTNATEFLASTTAAEDEIFVLDQLEILNADDPDGVFTGHLDLDHIGLFGQSLGGGASAQACYMDSRCKAGANEDGTLVGEVAIKGLDQPFLFFSNALIHFETTLPYKKARGPVYALRVIGASHLNFVDIPLWPPSALTIAPGIIGEIEPERAVHIVRTYLLAFFDEYLKGEPSELLEGASEDYPEVEIYTQIP